MRSGTAVLLPGVAILTCGILLACSGGASEPVVDRDQADDAERIRAMAEEDPDQQVAVQIVLNEPHAIDELVADLTARDLELNHVTGVLLAGGQQHSANVSVELAQIEFPRAYAEQLTEFAERMVLDLGGRLSPDCSSASGELQEGEYPCAPEGLRPNVDSTLGDFEGQIDEIRRVGYPVYALRVEGRAADVTQLLDDGTACAVGLPGERGLPSPYSVGPACWESFFPPSDG